MKVYHEQKCPSCGETALVEGGHVTVDSNSAWQEKLEYETHKAYRQGYREGRLSPANDAERFAEFVEDRNIDFRGQRRRDRRAETNS